MTLREAAIGQTVKVKRLTGMVLSREESWIWELLKVSILT